jgi:hypothetical protein
MTISGLLAALTLTACTSGPAAKPEVRIPTFEAPSTTVTPPSSTPSPTEEPVVEPPPTTSTKPSKKPPKTTPKTTTPKPPPSTSENPPPGTNPDGPFVRLGAPCTPEGAIGITRDGKIAACRKGGFPGRARWQRMTPSLS